MAKKIYTKLQIIADNEQKVFDSGVAKGHSEGYSEGYSEGTEEGKKAQEKAFWDRFLTYGATGSANYLFAGGGWHKDNWKPNRDLRPNQATLMFGSFMGVYGYGSAFDMVEHLEELGVTLDFSKSTSLTQTFNWASFTRIGVIDCSSTTSTASMFANAQIGIIDKFIVHENLGYNNTFQNLSRLTHMIVEGVIAKNGFNVQWAVNLDKESLTSIVNCLSTTTTGLTITLSLTAVNKAFETSEGANDGSTSTEWTSLTSAHQNWTISLV